MPLIEKILLSRFDNSDIFSYYKNDEFYRETNENNLIKYYNESGDAAGYWYGSLSEILTDVDENVLHLSPINEQRFNHFLKTPKQHKQKICAYELTFCAHKSFSIAALVGEEKRVFDWHQIAVRTAIDYAQKFIFTNHGKIGDNPIKENSENIIAGVFTHRTSREGDPLLHSHVIIPNFTIRSDGELRSIDAQFLYRAQKLILAEYHASMAQQAQESNFLIDNATNKSKNFTARLSEIPQEMNDAFSTSSKKIKQNIDSQNATPGQRAAVAKKIRKKKDNSKNYNELRNEWKEKANQIKPLDRIKLDNNHTKNQKSKPLKINQYVLKATESLSEFESVFTESELIIECVRICNGAFSPSEFTTHLDKMVNNNEIIREDHLYRRYSKSQYLTTDIAITEMENILNLCENNIEIHQPIYESYRKPFSASGLFVNKAQAAKKRITEIIFNSKLGHDQQIALQKIVSSKSFVTVLSGYAGTGKTTTLNAIRMFAEESNHKIIGLAPTKKSTAALNEANINNAQTIDKWLQSHQKIDKKSILIVDESSLVSSKRMAIILERAHKANARVLLVGDPTQYQSIERGRPFDQILNKTNVDRVELNTVRRQKNIDLRDAAKIAQKDASEALHLINTIEVFTAEDQYKIAAKEYVKNKDNAMILTGEHKHRKSINTEVRKLLNLEDKGIQITSLLKKPLTKGCLLLEQSFKNGDFLITNKDYKRQDISKFEPLKIISRHKQFNNDIILTCVDQSNYCKRINISKMSSRHFSIYEADNMEISVGDNLYYEDLTTRENRMLKVCHYDDEHIYCLNNKDEVKKIMRDKPHCLMYSYAMTGIKVQGTTLDRVILHKPSDSLTSNQRSFYTDFTRARHEAVVITDDAEQLRMKLKNKPFKICALDYFPPKTKQRLEYQHEYNEHDEYDGLTIAPHHNDLQIDNSLYKDNQHQEPKHENIQEPNTISEFNYTKEKQQIDYDDELSL